MASGGWSDGEIASIGSNFVAAQGEDWADGPWLPLRARSLGLAEASGGLLGAYRLRREQGEPSGEALCEQLDLQFMYVLRGSITISESGTPRRELKAGDAVHRTRDSSPYRVLDLSVDFEAVDITAPAREAQSAGSHSGAGRAGVAAVCLHDAPGAYALGAGPRPDVLYRTTGVSQASDGRYRVHFVRAAGPAREMDIWHYHDMAQWFMVLEGWARIEVHGAPSRLLEPGDALCIGSGPTMAHNVRDIGPGFTILEVCVPADYETWSVKQGQDPSP